MAAPSLETTVVTGYIYDYTNSPQSAIDLTFTVPRDLPNNPQADQNVFIKQSTVTVYTDSDGKFTITLPKDVWIHVECTCIGMDHDYYVGTQDTYDFDVITGYYRRDNYHISDGAQRGSCDFYSEDGGRWGG